MKNVILSMILLTNTILNAQLIFQEKNYSIDVCEEKTTAIIIKGIEAPTLDIGNDNVIGEIQEISPKNYYIKLKAIKAFTKTSLLVITKTDIDLPMFEIVYNKNMLTGKYVFEIKNGQLQTQTLSTTSNIQQVTKTIISEPQSNQNNQTSLSNTVTKIQTVIPTEIKTEVKNQTNNSIEKKIEKEIEVINNRVEVITNKLNEKTEIQEKKVIIEPVPVPTPPITKIETEEEKKIKIYEKKYQTNNLVSGKVTSYCHLKLNNIVSTKTGNIFAFTIKNKSNTDITIEDITMLLKKEYKGREINEPIEEIEYIGSKTIKPNEEKAIFLSTKSVIISDAEKLYITFNETKEYGNGRDISIEINSKHLSKTVKIY
jgi:hypothetical protein